MVLRGFILVVAKGKDWGLIGLGVWYRGLENGVGDVLVNGYYSTNFNNFYENNVNKVW